MLGWMISVYRQVGDRNEPASTDSERGALVAQWQGNAEARRWLLELVPTGAAVDLGGAGYPSLMSAKAGKVIPVVRGGPPHENRSWHADGHDILGPQWVGHTTFEEDEAADCDEDEWLIIEIWDES